ncbi:aminotransferase [Leucobacter zeae]|nr:aminotransferase [Leucobacter zeae]
MIDGQAGGLVRPEVTEADAVRIARERYGIETTATELGSNQDRNFALEEPDGTRSVLRVDNPVFGDAARDAQHAALDAYRAAGVPVPAVLAGIDGALTQRWNGFAVRRSEFAPGEPMVDAGYFAPVVVEEFGALAAASVNALAGLDHPGLDREQMWDMRVAHAETIGLAPAIADAELRERVLSAADAAAAALEPLASALPVQAIHGDLTDDNVTGVRGEDSRLHPHTVLDLGDLGTGWRVAELAVTASSLLHHEPDRPLRLLDAIGAFHRSAPLSAAEARAVWPLVVLRAALLVASGWRQLEIDGGNAYARERIAGEQAIFDAATAVPLAEATELVLARLGFQGAPEGSGLRLVARAADDADPARQSAPTTPRDPAEISPRHRAGAERLAGSTAPLAALLPELAGSVEVIDPGVESEALGSGKWLAEDAEDALVAEAFAGGAVAAVLPYGVYRLTRTSIDTIDPAATWPANTEIRIAPGAAGRVTSPAAATVLEVGPDAILLELGDGRLLGVGGVVPNAARGSAVEAGAAIGEVPGSGDSARAIFVGIRRPDALSLTEDHFGSPHLVRPERVPAWARFSSDPATLLGLPSLAQRDASGDEQLRRERIFASAQERYYERPMQVERGWRHHLVDTTGRAYIDMVNNVTGLGHGHPGVADAVNRQIRILNTNSRFLYRGLAEYSERLLALLPESVRSGDDGLDTVLLVNSGSEAVDLALRLAQAATGRKTVVSLREAYHGWTMASDAVTTSAYDNPFALANRPEWIHVADVPNRFRGTYRGEADDRSVGARYAADLGADLDRLTAEGRDVAGFICESVLGNAGGVVLPAGYLADAYDRVRAAGGLCIADEVQVGFGRMGSSFWGFEQSGVRPDIVAIAKPMGNGFPIGGVITTKRIADALATQGQFFSSAGGNPLSCQVGLAVLDAMEEEGLQENARVIGGRLAAGFRALAERHAIIGPVHGEGLYLGVELVRDRGTLEPATAEAAAICERMRELGVIVLTTSERSNVLKVKPPLCLTAASADLVVSALDRVLSEGW